MGTLSGSADISLSGEGELGWVTVPALRELRVAGGQGRESAPAAFASLSARFYERLALHVSLLKFLRSPAGRHLLNFVDGPGASRTPLTPRLPWNTHYCATVGHAVQTLVWLVLSLTPGRIGCPLTWIPPALGGVTGQGPWQSWPCLLPCSSCSGPGPLCWRVYINV